MSYVGYEPTYVGYGQFRYGSHTGSAAGNAGRNMEHYWKIKSVVRQEKQTRKDCWDQQCWHLGHVLHIQLSLHCLMEQQGSWAAILTVLL